MRLALIALILFTVLCAAIRLHEAREKSPVEWRGVATVNRTAQRRNACHGAHMRRTQWLWARGAARSAREHEADSVSRGSCFAARGATHISAQSSRLTASHKQCDNC